MDSLLCNIVASERVLGLRRYEAAMVDLQFAWKLPRQSSDHLTTFRAAVEKAFDALPADMKESVEGPARCCADSRREVGTSMRCGRGVAIAGVVSVRR